MTYKRKHSLNVMRDLEASLVALVSTTMKGYKSRLEIFEEMKKVHLTEDVAQLLFGASLVNDVIPYRLWLKARSHWTKPPFEEFEARNLWSWYNSLTWAYHGLPIKDIIPRHKNLSTFMNRVVIDGDRISIKSEESLKEKSIVDSESKMEVESHTPKVMAPSGVGHLVRLPMVLEH